KKSIFLGFSSGIPPKPIENQPAVFDLSAQDHLGAPSAVSNDSRNVISKRCSLSNANNHSLSDFFSTDLADKRCCSATAHRFVAFFSPHAATGVFPSFRAALEKPGSDGENNTHSCGLSAAGRP